MENKKTEWPSKLTLVIAGGVALLFISLAVADTFTDAEIDRRAEERLQEKLDIRLRQIQNGEVAW